MFSRFCSAGLKLKARKCQLARTQVTFLGHVVSKQGLQPDAKILEKVCGWPTLRTTTEVRAFVGLCSYYRRFVKHFSALAAPLHTLTQKGAIFKWTVECEDAFQSLIHSLTHPLIVAHTNFTQPFLLYMDTSQDSIALCWLNVRTIKNVLLPMQATHFGLLKRSGLPLTMSSGQ